MSEHRAVGNLISALQVLAALGCVVVVGSGHLFLGLGMLAFLVLVWPPAVPWRPAAAVRVLLLYLPFAVVWLAGVVCYLKVMHGLGHTVPMQPQLAEIAAKGASTPDLLLLCLGIVVVAPLAEEVLFRGYLFTALLRVLPSGATQIATAVLFGLVHGLDYALPIGTLSLLFGWLRARHASLLPSVLAHTVHNGVTIAVTLLWPQHLELLYPR